MFHVKHQRVSFKGRTTDFDSVSGGSIPPTRVRRNSGGNNENHITERKENMIKVKCEKSDVYVDEMEGKLGQIMSELCCIVDAVCTGFCSDEPEEIKDYMRTKMIRTIAETLIEKNSFEKNDK